MCLPSPVTRSCVPVARSLARLFVSPCVFVSARGQASASSCFVASRCRWRYMPWCPACSRVEPPGGQGKEGAADGGEVWDGLGGPGRLETRDLATQGSGTRAARLPERLPCCRNWTRGREGGRLAGWRGGGAPSRRRRRRRSVAFPLWLQASRWAGAWGEGLGSHLSLCLSTGAFHLQAQAKGSPTIPAPGQSSNSRLRGRQVCRRGPRRSRIRHSASPRLAESASHHRGRRPPTASPAHHDGNPPAWLPPLLQG